MLGTSILSNKNTLSHNTQRIIMRLALHLAANRTAFCSKLHCILHQITLHLAPNCNAFCTKLHCDLHHITLHFAPTRVAFCTKIRRFLLQTAHFQVIVAILCNIKGFASAYCQPPFCTKRTLARIDYLRPSERLVNYKPLIMLKFIP